MCFKLSLFNLQGTMLFRYSLLRSSSFILSHLNWFVKNFFHFFFQTFVWPPCSFEQRLCYFITFSSTCQALFFKFLIRFKSDLCWFLSSDLIILPHLSHPVNHFFIFFRCAAVSFCCFSAAFLKRSIRIPHAASLVNKNFHFSSKNFARVVWFDYASG